MMVDCNHGVEVCSLACPRSGKMSSWTVPLECVDRKFALASAFAVAALLGVAEGADVDRRFLVVLTALGEVVWVVQDAPKGKYGIP